MISPEPGEPGYIPPELLPMYPPAAIEAMVQARLNDMLTRDAAKEQYDAMRAADVAIPPPVLLSDALLMPEPDVKYRIKEVLPAQSRALLAAQQKAGKTTVRNNVIASLADGDDFLGMFPVTPIQPDRTVFVSDFEMNEYTTTQWLGDLNIGHPERVVLHSLRGKASTFNVLVPAVRRTFAKIINDSGAEVFVFDCVRPVMDALGLSEDKDGGRLLEALDELASEAGVSEMLVIHHMGHSNDRARGDSRFQDWADVNWRLLKANQTGQRQAGGDPFDPPASDDGGVRLFTANGRDVNVPRGALSFDPSTRRLTYQDLGAVNLAADMNWLREVLIAEPGLGINKTVERLKAVASMPYKRAQAVAWRAIEEGSVEQVDGPRNSKRLTWIGGAE